MVRRLGLVIVLTAAGCTYVTRGAFEKKRDLLDEDKDGVEWAKDCDDQDATRSPNVPETPYDGIDNDCGGDGDLVDVDGDGFPGVDPATYEGEMPERYVGKPRDCADDPAVIPEAANIFPDPTGDLAIDIQYDGLDSDCDRSNDFDADGDGWMPTTVEIGGVQVDIATAFAEYRTLWGITDEEAAAYIALTGKALTDPLIFQDCDDLDADIRPESPDFDAPYDGLDRNCDDINDFDADGDGFMPPGIESDYQSYVARYYGAGPPPFVVPPDRAFEDCLDVQDPTITSALTAQPADPFEVHPGVAGYPVTDVPYDGIDNDCNRDNDFDADGDAYLPSGYDADYLEYINDWQITAAEITGWAAANPDAGLTEPGTGDCDDTDPIRWPGALEILGDGVSQDCELDGDTSPFGFSDFTWTLPTNPEVGRVDDQYLLMIGASSAQLVTAITELGVGIPFSMSDARGGRESTATTYPTWKGNPTTFLQGVIDAAPDPQPEDVDSDGIVDPTLYVGTTYANTFQTWVYLSGIRYQSAAGALLPPVSTFHNLSPVYVANDVDLVFDGAGDPFTLACASDRLHAIYTDDTPAPNTASLSGTGADVCYFTGEPIFTPQSEVEFERCSPSCETWTLTDQPALFQGPPTGETWAFGDYEMGWLVRVDTAGNGTVTDTIGGGPDTPIMPGQDVVWADVSEHAGTLFVASVIDTGTTREVWLEWSGAQSGSQNLGFVNDNFPDAEPSSIAVHADADRVFVAVTALDPLSLAGYDSVGWVFLGPP